MNQHKKEKQQSSVKAWISELYTEEITMYLTLIIVIKPPLSEPVKLMLMDEVDLEEMYMLMMIL